MQLYARDSNKKLVHAANAFKQKDYACLECLQKVRIRSGTHRKTHFYHIQPNIACKQHSKGTTHIAIQQHLKGLLPQEEAHLEYHFPSIGRIADVAWIPQRIIYEIQCSPISPKEIENRNRCYASIGFQVVWIFHDKRYNKYRLSSAEQSISERPHYYTNMNSQGEGIIYDQFSLIHKGIRKYRLPRLSVDLSLPKITWSENTNLYLKQKLPKRLLERARLWKIGFSGDIIDRFLMKFKETGLTDYDCHLINEIEKLFHKEKSRFFPLSFFELINLFLQHVIIIAYRSILRIFLERACK